MKRNNHQKDKKKKIIYTGITSTEVALELALITQDMSLRDFSLNRLIRGR